MMCQLANCFYAKVLQLGTGAKLPGVCVWGCYTSISSGISIRVGRYFDLSRYFIEGRNLSDDISKLLSCSMTIMILIRMCMKLL